MMPGPIPKSPRLRVLENNPGKRPAPSQATPITAGVPSPPKSLKGHALTEWHRVTRLMAEEGYLSRLDRSILTAYCLAWGRLLSAQEAINDGGPMVTSGSHGGRQPRVELRIARDATTALVRLAADLGLSPAARARLGRVEDADRKTASWLPEELRGGSYPPDGKAGA